MLITLTLFVFAIAVIALAAMALRRSSRATEPKEARNLDPERVEAEVYEKLYGKRLGTVSAPLPVEPPPKTDPDSASAHTTSAEPGGITGDPEGGNRIAMKGHAQVSL